MTRRGRPALEMARAVPRYARKPPAPGGRPRGGRPERAAPTRLSQPGVLHGSAGIARRAPASPLFSSSKRKQHPWHTKR
ncbi:hypothetical protein P355_4846 [Burkholderia cenocepacia KC-01]|nr:hypothetical protein P355_4846 [Burkholderia cenocepacia KC-01]